MTTRVRHRSDAAWGLDAGSDGLNWRLRGACRDRQYDPNLWTSVVPSEREQANWVCRNLCQVRRDCFRWADSNRREARGGVYGGFWWYSRREGGPVRPVKIGQMAPTGFRSSDGGEPAFSRTPATEADRIAWMWAAGVPLTAIVEKLGCDGGAVANVIAGLRKAPGTAPPRPRSECGTRSGRQRHKRRGEPVCDRCLRAEAEYRRELRAQRRVA